MRRMTAAAIATLSLLATPGQAQLTGASTLNDYLAIAVENHPMLAREAAEWTAAREAIGVSRGWPDPTLSYTRSIDRAQTVTDPRQQTIGLTQMVPWFGKLSLRARAAEHEALAAQQRWRLARLEVGMRTAMAFYEYAYLSRAIDVTRENQLLLEYQEGVVRAKYRTDTARYADLVKVQVELGVLEDRIRTLEDQRQPHAARLNEALGRDSRAALPWPIALELPEWTMPDDETALAAARDANPGLLSIAERIVAREKQVDLARRDRFPDLMLGVMAMTASDDAMGGERDEWSAMVAFDLPLWRGKYDAAIRQARADERAAEHTFTDTSRRLQVEVQDALFRLRDADRKIDLYGRSLVLKAEQAVQSMATAYQTGSADFLDFLDAERTLLAFQLELERARADWGQRSVEVLALMGRSPLDAESTDEGDPR